VPEPDDMTPVTRGELRAELGEFEQKLEQKLDQKLELWTGALLARMETLVANAEQRLSVELARHVETIHSALRSEIAAIGEPHANTPARLATVETRVARLEDAVFPPPRKRARRRG